MGSRHLISTYPRLSQCPRCGAYVLSCYVMGSRTRLDPTRLTLRGEAIALLAGSRTFQLGALGRHGPARRTSAMIYRGLPDYAHVHAEHLCGLDLSAHPDGRTWFDTPQGDECPF